MSNLKRFGGAIVQTQPIYMKDLHEEDLDTLQDAPADNVDTQNTPENPAPNAPKDIDWENRYVNLQSHTSKQLNEANNAINSLKEHVSQLQSKLENASAGQSLPKTKEEIAAWANNYPDLAGVIATIAGMQADERLEKQSKKTKDLEEQLQAIAQEKFRTDLRKLHPDCDEIEKDPKFAEWFAKQRPAIQQLVQSNDVADTAYALNLYKKDNGLTNEAAKEKLKEASKAVNLGSSKPETTQGKKIWKESEIMRIPRNKFAEVAAEIETAQAEGRIDYDISNNTL